MYRATVACICVSLLVSSKFWNKVAVEGRKGIGGSEQEWGHVTVRPHAHMFWWLFYTTANVSEFTERPLIIWLQGGPGMPSSGYGNFVEIGPLDKHLRKREDSWVNEYNILFIDNPVGVGYSFISANKTRMVQNNKEIGEDLLNFFESFIHDFKAFEEVPLYIFGESYGGKMAVEFAYQLQKRIDAGRIRTNLKGIGLGDAYISPLDYILNYATIGLSLGLVDKHGYKIIDELTEQVKLAISKEDFETASDIEAKITDAIVETTLGIDIYNINLKTNISSVPRFLTYQNDFNYLMNTKVREVLNISDEIKWSFINDDIYSSLQSDLMRPVTHLIEILLNTTDVKVIVYNGVFDFIVNTAGTVLWLDNLFWKERDTWHNASKLPLEVNLVNEGYIKNVSNLIFYTVLRAGHSVPVDNPVAMEAILRRELLDS